MATWNTTVSAQAWNDLHDEYVQAGGESATDHDLAEILRTKMIEVEG
jgi:hypothetical protein